MLIFVSYPEDCSFPFFPSPFMGSLGSILKSPHSSGHSPLFLPPHVLLFFNVSSKAWCFSCLLLFFLSKTNPSLSVSLSCSSFFVFCFLANTWKCSGIQDLRCPDLTGHKQSTSVSVAKLCHEFLYLLFFLLLFLGHI